MIRCLHNLYDDRRGTVMLEFVMALPVLMLLLLGGVDLSRLVILSQKLDRVTAAMGDLVAQADKISQSDLNNIFAAVPFIAAPFDFAHNGVVIISSVSLSGGVARVNWQSRGAGNLTTASQIGVSGGVATLPAGVTVTGSNTLIISEVYFNFQPYFGLSVVPARQLYHRSFYRPRLGSLNSLTGS